MFVIAFAGVTASAFNGGVEVKASDLPAALVGVFVTFLVGAFVVDFVGVFVTFLVGAFVVDFVGVFVTFLVGAFVVDFVGVFVTFLVGVFVVDFVGVFVTFLVGVFVVDLVGVFVTFLVGVFSVSVTETSLPDGIEPVPCATDFAAPLVAIEYMMIPSRTASARPKTVAMIFLTTSHPSRI